ncbi:MAG: AgmX/PglI C-terminal domain-containing protein [Alphaproteobacteria bacterium]|nr:AgmX/PglI C-terminal domain-containing protein [Alphaproteobacteria bacterium]MCB9793491.1 AgmX/PglI C-terminal domain-containing protein [Alphaproteobacteria bacterium]
MGKCPFCSGEVNEDLIVYGGPCPHCFNEIPGEEAATDPGAVLRAQEAEAEAATARRKQIITAAIVLLMLAAAGGTYGYFAKKKAEEEAILYVEFDADFDIFNVDPGEWEEIYGEPAPEEVAGNTTKPATGGGSTGGSKKPKQAAMGGGSEPPIDAGPDFDAIEAKGADALSGAKATGPSTSPSTGGSSLSGGGMIGGIGANINSSDVTLRSDAEIKRHIGNMMKRNSAQVKYCYEQTLKANPEFQGTFTLNYTVQKDGTTKDVSLTGPGLDPTFERCLVSKVQTWKFYKLSKEAPVKYPLPLKPGM